MKVTRFDKRNLPAIRAAMNVALKTVGEKYGVDVHVGACKYQPSEATWKVKTSILDSDGANKQAKEDFIFYGKMHGFDAEDFGAKFTNFSGEEFKIIGWLPRRRKYPIQAASTRTGKTYIFSVQSVLTALGKADKIQHSFRR